MNDRQSHLTTTIDFKIYLGRIANSVLQLNVKLSAGHNRQMSKWLIDVALGL